MDGNEGTLWLATQTPLLFASQSYSQLSIRPQQPTQQGLPPGSGQHPPVSPATETKDPPQKPNISIAVAPSGIVLSWYMALEERHAPIMNYQLFALQDGGTTENPHQWKKIGVVKALTLPIPLAFWLSYHPAISATSWYALLMLMDDRVSAVRPALLLSNKSFWQ